MMWLASCSGSSSVSPPVPPSRHSTLAGSGCCSRTRTTWTPTPSSPMMTLPKPSTSVLFCLVNSGLFVTLLHPIELPSAYDRGYSASSLDVVVIEGKIDVNDDKGDKEPQKRVVPEAHAKFAAHQRHNPDEHPRKPRSAHAGVQRKAGDGLEDEREEGAEIDHTSQRVVPVRDGPVLLGFQNVGFDDVDNLLPLRLLQREKRVPVGVLVADEAPIEPRQEVEDVNESGREGDEAHPAEPVLLVSLGRVKGAHGSADQVAGDAQGHQGDCIDPMVGAHRQFPHVHAPGLDGSR